MTVVVPSPLPLDMPPGDPGALEDVVEDVAGTAYRLAVVGTCLTSSSATAPHWRSADATAAAAQVAVVARLAEDLSAGAEAAAHRLRAHHDLLVRTRQRVAALRAEQNDDFAAAWGRLSRIENYQLVAMTDGPEAVAVVEDLRAAESARRREHLRLLDELAEDAAATGRALADACGPAGGSGRHGDGSVVVAHLAAELPGWGEAELRRRGADLAQALLDTTCPEDREQAAREAAALAGSAAFAGAFLAGLGEYGVGGLLALLGDGDFPPTSALARTLALALGAAVPPGSDRDAVDDVLRATYIDPDDPGTAPDLVALGMGLVLRAGGAAGPRPETVVAWGRQMLDRERALGSALTQTRAVDRDAPVGDAVEPVDPIASVLARLTRDPDPSAAAEFLSERSTWDVLLSRPWDDGVAAFTALVGHAATADGPIGGDAARSGLEALGAGLENGDPDGWTVDRGTAAAVSGALGEAVAAHVSLVAGALERAADGSAGPRDGDALRGLGYLTLDEGAARAVERGVHGWAGAQAGDLGASAPAQLAVVPAGFVAVREYGQRLAYALHGFEQQAAAELRARRWDAVTTILTLPVSGPRLVGKVLQSDPVGVGLDYAAMVFDSDGTHDNGVDEGARYGHGDAVLGVLRSLPHDDGDTRELARRAVVAFDGVGEALGSPVPPRRRCGTTSGPCSRRRSHSLRGRPGGWIWRSRCRRRSRTTSTGASTRSSATDGTDRLSAGPVPPPHSLETVTTR